MDLHPQLPSVEQETASEDHGANIWNNKVVLKEIFKFLSLYDLLEVSVVNKNLNHHARTFILAHRKSYAILTGTCPKATNFIQAD